MFPKFLRIAAIGVHKYPVRINESTTIYQKRLYGADMLQLNILAEALGFSYEVVFAPDGDDYGIRLPNDNWTGSFGMLQRGEADLLIGSLNVNHEPDEFFHLSYPHSVSQSTFVTRKPEHVPNTVVFLHPFSIQVWLTIIACVCVVPFIFQHLLRKKHSPLKLFTSTVVPLVGQGMELIPDGLMEYLVLGTWILSSALLYYFYAAVLLSFVTFPSLHGISNIDDLANGIKVGKYQSAMHPSAGYDTVLSEIPNPSFHVIGKNLQENEGTDDFIKFLETPIPGKKSVYIGVKAKFLPFKDIYFISEDIFWPVAPAYAMRKDFCCAPDVDKVIHRVWASGILQKFQAVNNHFNFRFYLRTYEEQWRDPPPEAPLTMAILKGPFIFLIVSHSLAFLVFLIEVCIGKFKRNKQFQI